MIRLLATVLLLFQAVPAYADVPSTVVDAAWLKARLDGPHLSVIEVSSAVSHEFDGHVPGAAQTTKSGWRVELADGTLIRKPAADLQAMIRALGVDDHDTVVIYSKGNERDEVLGAAYLVWLFHYLGHPDTALLSGGWPAWVAVDGPVETDAPLIKAGTFIARPQEALVISTAELAATHKDYTVIDGRPASHFRGAEKFPANTKYGRIPGSVSQPWPDYMRVDDDGLEYMVTGKPAFLNTNTQDPERPWLLTCFGGTGAAMNFVLFSHYGITNMRLHDAGLREWNARDLSLVKGASN